MAADAVRAGDLGELVFATWRFGGEPGTSSHPHANLIETQCHGLDMLEHLGGPIDSVTAQMTDKTGRGYSTLVAALHFANGAVGSLVGSYDSSYAYPATHQLELNGTSGRVLIQDTVGRYSFTRAGSEVSSIWQAGYFNDTDRQSTAPSTSTSTTCSKPSEAAPNVKTTSGNAGQRGVVGLPGLEPGTSPLSDIDGRALCYPASLQLALIHELHRDGVNHVHPPQLAVVFQWRAPRAPDWSSGEPSWPRADE
jgi:hypothetical protein